MFDREKITLFKNKHINSNENIPVFLKSFLITYALTTVVAFVTVLAQVEIARETNAYVFYRCTALTEKMFIIIKTLEMLIPTTITFGSGVLFLQNKNPLDSYRSLFLFLAIVFQSIILCASTGVQKPEMLLIYNWSLSILAIITILLSWINFSVIPEKNRIRKKEPSDGSWI